MIKEVRTDEPAAARQASQTEPAVHPAGGRRHRHHEQIVARLLAAAEELMATGGIDHTTVQQITDLADLGKGTFFNYFKNKEAVIPEFVRRNVFEIANAVERTRAGNAPVRSVISELLRTSFQRRYESVGRVRFDNILRTIARNEEIRAVVAQIQAAWVANMADIVAIGQERGEFRTDCSARELATVIHRGITGVAIMAWEQEGNSADDLRTFEILLDALAPPKPAVRVRRSESRHGSKE